MSCKSSLVLMALATITLSLATNSFAMPQSSKKENLMLTFDNKDDIPSAFFDGSGESSESPQRGDHEPRRISYVTCKDGSGGLCVPSGQCPTHLKPENSDATSCVDEYECCYGVPISDKSCHNKGGECVSAGECGKAPKLQGTECSGVNGQVCCVYV